MKKAPIWGGLFEIGPIPIQKVVPKGPTPSFGGGPKGPELAGHPVSVAEHRGPQTQ